MSNYVRCWKCAEKNLVPVSSPVQSSLDAAKEEAKVKAGITGALLEFINLLTHGSHGFDPVSVLRRVYYAKLALEQETAISSPSQVKLARQLGISETACSKGVKAHKEAIEIIRMVQFYPDEQQ